MYQASIRDKKKHKQFHHEKNDNYEINIECEEYAIVKKLLGNCRVQVITNSAIDAIGIIRGSMRKFNKRVIIEVGDIVVVSKRDYQNDKVDIVHKYNTDQVQNLLNDKKLSTTLTTLYQHNNIGNDDNGNKIYEDNYVDFGIISSESDTEE